MESNTMVALVFPPYNVMLKDSPGQGNIMAFGNQHVNGNVIQVIGMSTVNALVPNGYTFNSWIVDAANTANIVLGNAASNPTSIEVMGEAILTATFH
jgi:hypothetical protein